MPFVYSNQYFADIGPHVFPIIKYREVFQMLRRDPEFHQEIFVEPRPVLEKELLMVHTEAYLDDLRHARCTERTQSSELPLTEEIVAMFELAAGGTTLAAELAVKNRWCVHLSGGFHHAFADKAEGFCYLNDLAIAARSIQQQQLATKIAIIDCDLHQGNGTAHIFRNDDSVFTFSIHQRDLYPIKRESDLDIHLPIHTADTAYLQQLRDALSGIFSTFKPHLVLYQAGADPYKVDQLGNLALTIDGLRQRDLIVFEACLQHECPVAVTLGGGYAFDTRDTVQIHCNTCKAARQVFGPQ